MRTRLAAAAVLALGLALAPDARADSGECRDGTLVETGYSMQKVFDKCGEPARRIVATPQNGMDPSYETWIYVPASGAFPRVLRFHFGVLESVRNR
jgi:hypothetical protein